MSPHRDESNDILQTKITFTKINPRNKLGVSRHSRYDYKSTNYYYNNYQKLQHIREDYKIPPSGKTVMFVRRGGTKHLNVKTEGNEIFVIIYEPIHKAKPISLL